MILPKAVALLVLLACVSVIPQAGAQDPGRFAGDGIAVGLEYVYVDKVGVTNAHTNTFAETGMHGLKPYAESVAWGEMQKASLLIGQPVDFTKLDRFVKKAQNKGFAELTIALKSHSEWASTCPPDSGCGDENPTPNTTAHEAEYSEWIRQIVERYNGNGQDDPVTGLREMDGLRWPVKYFEIGSEFSSYEPEPVDEYLHMLELAHTAAKGANPGVIITHAAFVITPANFDVASPADLSDYTAAWAAYIASNSTAIDRNHGLADIRAVLDRDDLFDVINIHNLGSPYEIEHLMQWLSIETAARGYTKDVIISDTIPTSYNGWGPATCKPGSCPNACEIAWYGQGLVIAPAVESDRCQLNDYFIALMADGNLGTTMNWTRAFVASDHVQRTVIAAEQGVKVINLSFTQDIWWLKAPVMHAGAGISAWAGAIHAAGAWVTRKYPLFYAIKQMMGHITGYTSIEREDVGNHLARVYKVQNSGHTFWIGWYDTGLLLPDHGTVSFQVSLNIGGLSSATFEKVITASSSQWPAFTEPTPEIVPLSVSNGIATVDLTHSPGYIYAS